MTRDKLADFQLEYAIDTFLKHSNWRAHSTPRNTWLSGRYSSLYIRVGSARYLSDAENVITRVFDLANISINPQGRGIFTHLIGYLETRLAREELPLYIENVLEPRLDKFFLNRGYKAVYMPRSALTRTPGAIEVNSYWKVFP